MTLRISNGFLALTLAACGVPQPADDAFGVEPVHVAARQGDLATLQTLLDSGVGVETRDAYERTALHWAALRGEVEAAELLTRRGAAIDARAWYDMQPLHWASLKGKADVARMLLSRGAHVDAVTFHGLTSLHLAKTAEVARLLLESGADIHALDVRGMTPMHLSRTQDVAQVLIDEGTNLGIQARDGRRPFDMSMAANDGPERVVIHPGGSTARLRHDQAVFRMAVMSLCEDPIQDVQMAATSPAANIRVEPTEPQTLHPAQIMSYALHLERVTGAPPGEPVVVVEMTEGNEPLADFDVELDARREETPEDRGMVRVAEIELRPPTAVWQYLAFLAPLLLLAGVWALRHRRGRTSNSQKGASLRT
jgi:hypothetical protein